MQKGSKLTDEQKENISRKLRGRKLSAEHRKNISVGSTGISRGPCSDEKKAKLSAANRRFAEKNKRPFDELWTKDQITGCHVWMGSRFASGYGQFYDLMKGMNVRAHRYSYERVHGEVPDQLWVLHKCDNPPCVNLDHLFVGTAADNANDRENKNRGRFKRNLTQKEVTNG